MKKLLVFTGLGFVFIGTTAFILNSGGIADRTGSPGETTCSACHSGGAGTTIVSISATPSFSSNQFVIGQTYTVSCTVSNSAFTKFGFDAEILDASNVNAGNITAGLTGVQIINTTRRNVTQTISKTGIGSAVFEFVWVAPLSGNATIYVAGNAINGTGGTGLDTPGSTSLALNPDFSPGINEAVQSGISGLKVYPNPVKSEFNISYNLIEKAVVKTALYDLQGKKIVEIASENQNPGAHTLMAELPTDLAKGVYFVELSIEGKQQARRLIITY